MVSGVERFCASSDLFTSSLVTKSRRVLHVVATKISQILCFSSTWRILGVGIQIMRSSESGYMDLILDETTTEKRKKVTASHAADADNLGDRTTHDHDGSHFLPFCVTCCCEMYTV